MYHPCTIHVPSQLYNMKIALSCLLYFSRKQQLVWDWTVKFPRVRWHGFRWHGMGGIAPRVMRLKVGSGGIASQRGCSVSSTCSMRQDTREIVRVIDLIRCVKTISHSPLPIPKMRDGWYSLPLSCLFSCIIGRFGDSNVRFVYLVRSRNGALSKSSSDS